MILSNAGTLELPPTTSTVCTSAGEIWASSKAYTDRTSCEEQKHDVQATFEVLDARSE